MIRRVAAVALVLAGASALVAPVARLVARSPAVAAARALRASEFGPEFCDSEGSQIYGSLSEFAQHAGRCVVVKYGGHAMSDDAAADAFAEDIVLLQKLNIRPVVVHGGGPQIGSMLARLNTTSTFVDGLRVTDGATVKVSEMVLSGSINKQIAAAISRLGGRALGLSGKDDRLLEAEKLIMKRTDATGSLEVVDLGFVGEPTKVNAALLEDLMALGITPVIAPIAVGAGGETFSVNADTAAGAVAEALCASRLLLLTDVAGVLDGDMRLVPSITPSSAKDLINDGVISGGMIPKLQTAVHAVEAGCGGAAIVDGRVDHAVLKELFSAEGAGTLVSPDTVAAANATTA